MAANRRRFLQWMAGSALVGLAPGLAADNGTLRPTYRAIVFDAFPIFDPRPIAALAETLLPGQGLALMTAWRARQFEY